MESRMQTIYPHCCGLDVHKEFVSACVAHLEADGVVRQTVRTFGTMTRDLLELADWLATERVKQVAMESTGVYWKPIWNLLEDRFTVWLVNARHIKNVPGRKTDVADCAWIAQLLQHGLLRPSFVPERAQRQLRDLTRQRTQLIEDKTRVVNRVQKVLEDANIKLASVATDPLGVSGRKMIQALIEGQTDARAMSTLARGRLRNKLPQLQEALRGQINEHHQFMLKSLMGQLQWLEEQIACFGQRIETVMSPLEHEAIRRLDEIPGMNRQAAENVIAEIGTDMTRFPSARHLASWAGLCPGNNRTANKRKSGRCTDGNRFLKATLNQCAWAASRSKGTYLSAQYRRLAKRRGARRAIMGVAHSQLTQAYELLKRNQPYRELTAAHFDTVDPQRQANRLVKRLEQLGYHVTLDNAA